MCHEASGAAYDRPLVASDVPLIHSAYAQLPKQLVEKIFTALTDHHYCKPAVLIAVLEMVHRHQQKDRGLYQFPTMPFSAMDINTLERVQTDGMYAFHAVFESMALAERNMQLLNAVLRAHAQCNIVLFCDCGCSIVDAEYDAYNSEWYQTINRLRSLAEAVGTRVVRIGDFTDIEWTNRPLDMGTAEITSYTKMYHLLQQLPAVNSDVMSLAQNGFGNLFASGNPCSCDDCRNAVATLQ